MQVYASLLATNAREQWEKHFEQDYIQPVLSVSKEGDDEWSRAVIFAHTHYTHTAQALEKQMGVALQLIFDDKKEGECIINVPLTSSTPFPSQIEIGCFTQHMRSHLWPPPPPLFSLTCGHIALISHWTISTRHCRHRRWSTSVQFFMSFWRRLAVVTSSTSYCWLIVYSQEPILRATRYLPELVQLQKQMFEFSHRRLDRKEAARVTIREYISSLNSG